MKDEYSLTWKLKTLIWSISAGTIVSFFFATNFLDWATSFNPGGSILLISPIMCGLLLGIVTWEADAIQTVLSSFILTTTATVGVILTLTSPMLLGVAWVPDTYYIYVAQNVMISIILILPLSLLGAMVGRFFSENTIMSSDYRKEREMLKSETDEWYQMLEEKLEEKRAALAALDDVRTEDEPEVPSEIPE
ncbi:MAG: hypothetical protein KAJ33_04230 [Thermoplasmata archaeon]|nr:hypothetical protein [Thermoplasmata archaeon]